MPGSPSREGARNKRKSSNEREEENNGQKRRGGTAGDGTTSNAMPPEGSAGKTANDMLQASVATENGEDDDVVSYVDVKDEEELMTLSMAAKELLPQESNEGDRSDSIDEAELAKMLDEKDAEGRRLYSLHKTSMFKVTMTRLYRICRQPSTYAVSSEWFKWSGTVTVAFQGTLKNDLYARFEEGSRQPGKEGLSTIHDRYLPTLGVMTLFLRTVEQKKFSIPSEKWHEWLYVKRRDPAADGNEGPLGLYSCRRFAKGEIIGPYEGAVYWSSKESSHNRPNEAPEKVRAITKGAYLHGPRGTCLVSPLVTAEHKAVEGMMMGFRFMARSGSKKHEKQANVEIKDNGFVVATRTIKTDTELVSPL